MNQRQWVLLALLTAAVTGCLARPAAYGTAKDPYCDDIAGFVWMRGIDTLALERVSLTSAGLLDRQAYPDRKMEYYAAIDSSLVVVSVATRRWSHENGHAVDMVAGRYELDGDTALYGEWTGRHVWLDHDGVAPYAAVMVSGTTGLEELMLRRARLAGRDSVDMPTFHLAAGVYAPTAHVRFIGGDSARIRFGADSVVDLRVDREGRIMRAYYPSAAGPPVVVQRVQCGVVDKLIEKREKS